MNSDTMTSNIGTDLRDKNCHLIRPTISLHADRIKEQVGNSREKAAKCGHTLPAG